MRSNNHSPGGLRIKKRDCVSKTKGPSVRPLSRFRGRGLGRGPLVAYLE